MNLTRFLLRKKMLINMLAVFLFVAGMVSVFNIPREAFPNIEFDIVTIATPYSGANAQQMERLITDPIEKELKNVDDVKEMWSISTEGMSVITVVLEADIKNKDRVINEIQRAVDRVDDLPTDLQSDPIVRDVKTKNTPMMEISLSGPYSQLELQDWARKLEDRLLELKEISSVRRQGYYDPQFHVEIDPRKLVRYHISLTEVGESLARQNVNVPGGTMMGSSGEVILRTTGEFFSTEEIEKVIVRANDQGNPLTVGDLAEVLLSHERPQIQYRTDGERAIILWPLKREGEDVFVVKEKMIGVFEEFKTIAPTDLQIALVNDFSYYVKRRLNVLKANGIIGLSLVVIPILLFLNRKTALGALMGMPVAFLTSFAVMHWMGITINLMSMFGLIMVIGMLVDEDIVIAENIHRMLQEGKSYKDAIIQGTTQVTKAVLATVLTTITAFTPLMLMTGIMGKFISHIPQVVIITLLASMVEALIILPVHIASLSKSDEKEMGGSFQDRFFGKKTLDWFERQLRWIVQKRYKICLSFFVLLLLTVALWHWRVDYVTFPSKGIEIFFVRAEMPLGTPLRKTAEELKALERKIAKLPAHELDHYVTEIGMSQNDPNDPFTKRGSHIAQIKVFLTPESQREREVDEIVDSLRPSVEGLSQFARVSFDSVQPGPPIGKPVAVRLKGSDLGFLQEKALLVEQALKSIEGVTDIRSDFELGKVEKRLVINHERVAQSGLSLAEVAQSVRYAFEGGIVTTVKRSDEDYDVVVKFPEELRYDPNALYQVKVSNRFGNLIPISEVSSFEEAESLEAIRHHDQKRTITVSAAVDKRVTTPLKVNRALENHLKKTGFDDPNLIVNFGGEMEDTQESIQSFFRAFALAILFMFIVIAATLSSLGAPIIILSTVFLGLMGIVLGFAITGENLNFLALMGVVGMAGVVVNAAILIVDFVHKKDDEGLSPHEAVIQGTKLRVRPILLTTVTTLLGIIPASIGLGGSDPFIQPMARALNWGIGFGTMFTLILLPAMIAVARDVRASLRAKAKQSSFL